MGVGDDVMPRKRDPRRDQAFEIWKQSNGEKKLKDIAAELEVADTQVRKWKSQDKWNDKTKGNVTNQKRNVTKKEKPRYPNGHPGNKNPENQFTERNQSAKKHGLFSRYIPQATLEIMGMLDKDDPADLIWDQIQIQYAAIIRSQEIMFVESNNDMTKEIKKSASGDGFASTEYEIQFAWDKQASFLTAQSRAMSELRGLIKQFNDFAHDEDERKLKLQLMQHQIDKTKAEVEKLSKDESNSTSEVAAALRSLADGIN